MKAIKGLRILVLMAALLFLSGCAMTPGGISSSNIPIGNRSYTVVGRARDTKSRVYLFGFIPVSGANTTRAAMDGAIRSRRGDALINITVEAYAQNWIILTRYVTRVEGDVITFDRQ